MTIKQGPTTTPVTPQRLAELISNIVEGYELGPLDRDDLRGALVELQERRDRAAQGREVFEVPGADDLPASIEAPIVGSSRP